LLLRLDDDLKMITQMGLFEAPSGKPLGASKPKEVSIFYSLA